MKKYAFYLPQFHRIPENDMWWGEGFTEWTNVKKANPLFRNHKQPKAPLNNNYYVLDNPEVLKWQADLANSYGIDGMIFYHYYFCGKKLLERPAEILLKNKDIPMNFFFCWANHSWFRSWEGSKELLLEQKYGKREDWEKHFLYLLPFFKDNRYLKIDNKPVFMLFKTDFEEKDDYIDYLNERCVDFGFSGIEIIETINSIEKLNKNDNDNIKFIREPDTSVNLFRKEKIIFRFKNKIGKIMRKLSYNYVEKYDGNNIFREAINFNGKERNIIRGLCFEWDNTPRHGLRGYLITPPSKENFMAYMDSIKDSDFLFINAWNEWCEGMILEPTEENGYKYLEWLKEWSEKNENRVDGI
ncbi:glycoside hydrolase family 99-like domain-containing protein [Streptococcus equinus]|uniref:glycosyltransferase WbsX family protein n=1 Tax=Streptococcus equinus TaxID=1335 RepID=UPI003BF909FE